MVPVTSLGPSPQSSTPCQQTFPSCTVCLVWLALGARQIPYGYSGLGGLDGLAVFGGGVKDGVTEQVLV